MDINTIKKELYKQKPKAHFCHITKAGIKYYTYLPGQSQSIWFLIPLSDIGDALFAHVIESQLLIRYIVMPETTTP